MPRTNRNRQPGFIWIPRDQDVASDITVDGTSVFHNYISAEFTRAISPEIGHFKINLINADGRFSNVYSGGEEVILKVDLASGTTVRFKGTIDSVKNKRGAYEILELSGGHLSSELLDITVTREYNGEKTCDEILKDIVDSYLTGYTYTNTNSSTVSPDIKWSNKPFWNCVEDLCRLAVNSSEVTDDLKRFDCYVDDDKDVHFFKENSRENNNEAIVWNDTLIALQGLGEQSTLTKNKIIVYGDDGTGLPIIRESEDDVSKSAYGLKEEIIVNTDIVTGTSAEIISDAQLALEKTPETQGKATCFILPSIQPGEKIWVSDPTMKITKQIKISKYTHSYPVEQSSVILTKERSIPGIFRQQTLKDIAQDDIINPYEMTKSINFTFDDSTGISTIDENMSVSGGKLGLSSGSQGTMTTETFTQTSDITSVHLLTVGELIVTMEIRVSTDGGDNWQTVESNKQTTVTAGKDIKVRITLNDINSTLDSFALLIK